MKKNYSTRSFGHVTVEAWEKRDKNNIGIGKPNVKTIFPAENLVVDHMGNVVLDENGFAVRG